MHIYVCVCVYKMIHAVSCLGNLCQYNITKILSYISSRNIILALMFRSMIHSDHFVCGVR